MLSFQIVGILNTTPDSYHDGGQFITVDQAVKRAGKMMEEGADIIEIGGESTGPGSQDVLAEEELRRTIPIIEAIRSVHPDAKLSIDTHKAQVAKEAIDRGVIMVNDVTAGRSDPDIFKEVAESNAQIVLMYSKDPTARTSANETQYDDVVGTVKTFLVERKSAAMNAEIPEDRIILDPGMGHFVSSDPQYSFQIIRELGRLADLGPLFISPSRKSFLAGSENLKTVDRLPGTIVSSALAVINGATYIRTHDVSAIKRGCNIALEITKH